MAEEVKKRSDITVVAQDKNWRDYISKEIKSADEWNKDWGFLAAGKIEDGQTEPVVKSKDEQIAEMEEKLKTMKARDYVTSSTRIGRGDTLECFPQKHHNI